MTSRNADGEVVLFLKDRGKRGEQHKEEAENKCAQEGKEEHDWLQDEKFCWSSNSAEE
jgi:hypothetical protein